MTATRSLEAAPERHARRLPAIQSATAAEESIVTRLGSYIGAFVLPFGLLIYLGLKGGGYDQVVRSEVGIAIWVLLVAGTLAGLLPVARSNRAALAALGLLAGLAVWTGASMLWTESREQTFEEVGRLVTYLGVFALALLLQGRDGLRRTAGAVAAAIVVLAGFALVSRLNPAWFPVDELAQAQSDAAGRLNYPLNSWNGLAALAAMGVPLLIAFGASARRKSMAAAATAAIPAVACAAYLTYSRSGLIALGIGVACAILLAPRRGAAAAVAGLGLTGTALAVAAASQRPAIEDLAPSADAAAQRAEMAVILLAVCVGVGLLRIALSVASEQGLLDPLPRPRNRWLLAGAAVVAVLAAVAWGPEVDRAWEEFKEPVNSASAAARFDSASGNGRYQYWSASVDAAASAPLNGIGAGAWELWWSREATLGGFTRYAHSLYLETFAELGIVGVALVVGLLALPAVVATRRLRSASAPDRWMLAGGVGLLAAFAVAAAFDWIWQLPVIPVAMLFMVAALLVRDPADRGVAQTTRRAWPSRVGTAGAGIVAIGLLAVVLIGARSLAAGEDALADGDSERALAEASDAADAQPWAAAPLLQRATALQAQGEFADAAAAAKEAIDRAETDWRPWYQLYLIEGAWGREVGAYQIVDGEPTFTIEALPHFDAARNAYARAQKLNPLAPFLATSPSHVTFEPVQ
jgi:hypothetical protein